MKIDKYIYKFEGSDLFFFSAFFQIDQKFAFLIRKMSILNKEICTSKILIFEISVNFMKLWRLHSAVFWEIYSKLIFRKRHRGTQTFWKWEIYNRLIFWKRHGGTQTFWIWEIYSKLIFRKRHRGTQTFWIWEIYNKLIFRKRHGGTQTFLESLVWEIHRCLT